ncbi:uncharacterized protein LOC116296782 [Actinia tenebrosa]|uniref:Uncharacterized protein LOC116296782 n=1 Tax=Actinia tenebrosa TaxID=6105 RepID=A0A6P8I7Q4_ACTTE|nr:uncharacterized protein LOC116296782 [Actinia tenebrosa]
MLNMVVDGKLSRDAGFHVGHARPQKCRLSPFIMYSGITYERKYKMAACLTVEEVLEEVWRDSGDDNDVDRLEDDLGEEEDVEKSKLLKWVENFDGGNVFDGEFFRRGAVDLLLPLLRLSSRISECNSSEVDARINVAHVLISHTITTGSILDSEARLWLRQIYRRLSGRVSIRRPYYAEIHRNIPYAIVQAMSLVIQQCPDELKEPVCYSSKNKKGHVISFTTRDAVIWFLSVITSMSKIEVRAFLTKKLKGARRNKHRVKVLVEDGKDFAFVYYHNKGLMSIQFHYGEWNTHDYPQHPCQLTFLPNNEVYRISPSKPFPLTLYPLPHLPTPSLGLPFFDSS